MLRQAGSLAQRLLLSGAAQGSAAAGPSRLLANAGFSFSTSVATDGAQTASQVVAASAMPAAAGGSRLFKKLGVDNFDGLKPFRPDGSLSRLFASSPAAAAAAPAAKPAAKPAGRNPFERLSKWFKAALLATAAAMGLGATVAHADAPEPWQWGFQDAATAQAQAMFDLHHDITFILITILALVFWMGFQIVTRFHYTKQPLPEKFLHHTMLELVWSVMPTLVIILIAIPSLTLIYSMDQITERPGLTVKIIGRQWYWSYECHDHLQHKLVDPDRLVSIAEKALK